MAMISCFPKRTFQKWTWVFHIVSPLRFNTDNQARTEAISSGIEKKRFSSHGIEARHTYGTPEWGEPLG
jgi:hypothetical protein